MIRRGQILFVDPYQAHRYTTVKTLERAGYPCVTVRQRDQAIQELQASHYDLMIVEIHMPVKAILELLQAVHQLMPELPVILFTQDPFIEKAIGDVHLKIKSFLIKPITSHLLVEEVQKAMIACSLSMSSSIAQNSKMDGSQDDITRINQLTQALEETIAVIESTRRSFKSRELAILRKNWRFYYPAARQIDGHLSRFYAMFSLGLYIC